MEDAENLSREQIQAFLDASQKVRLEGQQRAEVYAWITRTLRQQRYGEQGKPMRGLLLRYVAKMTGRSRTRVTRLVALVGTGTKTLVFYQQRSAAR